MDVARIVVARSSMSNDVLMAKSQLPPGTIDLGIGEPHLLRELLLSMYELDSLSFGSYKNIWEYAPPNGFEPLVKILEDRYQAKVVMTTGAKQGLLATCNAVRESGARTMSFRRPYWASIPHVVKHVGMEPIPTDNEDYAKDADSCLLVSPNNPDGACAPFLESKMFCEAMKAIGVPVIHDGAYYTKSYAPDDHKLGPLGDMQIFSVSKMYGLSGMRLGWVVCYNEDYYRSLTSYVEATTAGVSTSSQRVLLELLSIERKKPDVKTKFELEVKSRLGEAKHLLLREMDPRVLNVPANITSTPGMFAWCKPASGLDFSKVAVNVMDGAPFGAPGMIRMNLAVHLSELKEAIRRMNSLAP